MASDPDQAASNHDLVMQGTAEEDDDDLTGDAEALFGTSVLPINVDAAPGGDESTAATPTAATDSSTARTSSTSQKRPRSGVWKDMDKIFENIDGKPVLVSAKCIHCKHVLSARSTGGTGHLLRHQRNCLKKAAHAAAVQSRLALNPDGSVRNWEYSHAVARTELCRLIARLDLPLGIGEYDAFEEYIQRAHNPLFKKVTRQTTTTDMAKYFNERQAKIKEYLHSSVSSVALTSDIWSGNAKEDYLSVVAHYVSADWDLQKKVLGFRLIDVSHSGANISERIAMVLDDYGLKDKVVSISLDNASANANAMTYLTPKLTGYLGPDTDPDYSLLHQRCACHIINLIVKSGLKRLKTYTDAFRTAISYLNASNTRIAEYKNFCIAKGVRPRKFQLDMDVRWNSTYLMLKHLIPYKSTFTAYIAINYPTPDNRPLLTDAHWIVAEKVLEFLELFYESTVALSGVYYPTSPLILHHIYDMASHLHQHENDNLLRSVVIPMKLKYLKYWQKIPMLYSFAFVLDPRAKMRGFYNILQLLSVPTATDYSSYYADVKNALYLLFLKYERKFGSVRMQRPSQSSLSSGKRRQVWGKIFGDSGLSGSPPPSTTVCPPAPMCAVSEISAYLDSDTVTCYDDEFNIINWWHEHKLTYPILSILAKDIMSIPVSTVSSESCFSLTGRILEERRRSLKPETVEMLTCIKDWELSDARAQHAVENAELESSFRDLYLDEDK